MKLLFDFLPALLFFAAYSVYDIYIATAVSMVAVTLQVGWLWLRHRRVENTHWIMFAAFWIFGGLTLLLRDPMFIKWKPSIVYFVLCGGIVGTLVAGKKTALEFALGGHLTLPRAVWRKFNIAWAAFFMGMALLNLYVAYFYSESTWVYFKVFGLLGITLVFLVVTLVFLAKYMKEDSPPG